MATKYIYGGHSDIGEGRGINEDFFHFVELDDDVLFTVIGDGMGSTGNTLQSGALAGLEISQCVERLYRHDKETFLAHPTMMLKEAFSCANRILGVCHVVGEEKYSGFGAAVSAVLLYGDRQIAFAHTGNTRINLLRIDKNGAPKMSQISEDQTVAMQMLYDGIISADEYYLHPDRYKLSHCLGFEAEPDVQLFSGRLKKNDIIAMTTDGVHYSVRQEFIEKFILESTDWESAVTTLVNASKMQMRDENSAALGDNCTAVLLFVP